MQILFYNKIRLFEIFLFLCLFFLIYILYKYNKCHRNTLSALIKPQARFPYLQISVSSCLTQGFDTLKTQQNAICIALQCIELQCILVTSFALLCIALQCIFVLPIAFQCIAHQRIPDTHKKDPNFFANVRTRPLTDFIDFLGLKSIFVFWLFCWFFCWLCLCFNRFI